MTDSSNWLEREIREAGRLAAHLAIAEAIENDQDTVEAGIQRIANDEDALFASHVVRLLLAQLAAALKQLPNEERQRFLADWSAICAPPDIADLDDL